MSDLTPEKLAGLRLGAEQCAAHPDFPHDGIGFLVRAIPALLDAAELLAIVRDQITRGALCPMCSTGLARWTVGLVCQLCGTDYSRPDTKHKQAS